MQLENHVPLSVEKKVVDETLEKNEINNLPNCRCHVVCDYADINDKAFKYYSPITTKYYCTRHWEELQLRKSHGITPELVKQFEQWVASAADSQQQTFNDTTRAFIDRIYSVYDDTHTRHKQRLYYYEELAYANGWDFNKQVRGARPCIIISMVVENLGSAPASWNDYYLNRKITVRIPYTTAKPKHKNLVLQLDELSISSSPQCKYSVEQHLVDYQKRFFSTALLTECRQSNR